MSDDSDGDFFRQSKRKRRVGCLLDDEDEDADSSVELTKKIKGSKRNCIRDSDSDSESSVEVFQRRKRIARVNSDTSSSSSSSSIRQVRRAPRAISETSSDEDGGFEGSSDNSQWETDFSDSETLTNSNKPTAATENSTDSCDEHAEKCPICLLKFKTQEIGTPDSCDHTFCVDCIQEWSKNVNTCPVDRQTFNLILVRKCLNGKVIRQIPVEPANVENVINIADGEDDTTFCEICGMSDREDRMLLCDLCNLGFHLECLTPPLEEVPEGYWYCNSCAGHADFQEIRLILNGEGDVWFDGPHRTFFRRLMPRTRQSERVRQRIENNRRSNNSPTNRTENNNRSNSSGIEDSNQAGPSRSNRTTRRRRTERQRRRNRQGRRYRIVYEVDEVTGETIQVRKKMRKRKTKTAARRKLEKQKKTVKRRLASQLGICRQRSTTQHLPDVRSVHNSQNISLQRYEAGIPTLHLFGRSDEIDYFSISDDGESGSGGGVGVLFRRRPNRNDTNVLRSQMRRKRVAIQHSALPSSDDLLTSILESQTKLHSKNSVLSLNKDGTLKVENNNNRINVNNNNTVRYRQTPMQPNGNNENDRRNPTNSFSDDRNTSYNTFIPTQSTSSVIRSTSENSDFQERPHDYSQNALCDLYYSSEEKDKKDKDKSGDNCDLISGDNTPKSNVSGGGGGGNSDSEFDIYSDIETVSTSKMDDQEMKTVAPAPVAALGTDDENNDSDTELVIDTEKLDNDKYDPCTAIDSEESSKEETVSSSMDTPFVSSNNQPIPDAAHSTSELIPSSSKEEMKESNRLEDEDDGDEDGCPNFSIYSTESINLAKTTDLELLSEKSQQDCSEISSTPSAKPAINIIENDDEEEKQQDESAVENVKNSTGTTNALYSDSEDDVKIDVPKTFNIGDIQNMTEDISEEERSYTPCLDEKMKTCQEGLDGLDTEMISDEDRNDFDETHDLKTASDGDALEINAKDSELDFSKPEDYEEGEIVDKSKVKKQEVSTKKEDEIEKETSSAKKEKPPTVDDKNKENEKENSNNNTSKSESSSSFKKLSKSNKERNYRDKEKERSRSRSKDRKESSSKREKKKEKRKEIERYDVRTVIAEKPRRLKDKFGRDVSKRSPSRSSRSLTPYGSPARNRRSVSRTRKRRSRSRHRRSFSRSRTPERRFSRSTERRRSKSRNRKRRRSTSYEAEKTKRRSKERSRRERSHNSRYRSRSPSTRRRRDWERRQSKEWTPSLSRSRSAEVVRHVSPSWTPPRVLDKAVKSHNLTVILTNDSNKKKKEKKKKTDKKNKEAIEKRRKRRNKTPPPPPSKEVFASGDNILVSVSFNKDNETRDVTTKRKRVHSESVPPKKPKKNKTISTTAPAATTPKVKKTRDLSGVKPVAIIDLDKSPFKELTPSPKDIIVLSDSDNGETNENVGIQKAVCDSSQQVASPEASASNNYTMGPKTPPEPQIKFSLNPKPQQLRPITNPLHEPDEVETEIETQEELNQRPSEVVHKGPNTPPEPPNSPPSSPDAYDPFDPTKSRSPTPEPVQTNTQSNNSTSTDNDNRLELRPVETDKSNTPVHQTTPDILKSHTPPLLETQPDSQSSILTNTPDRPKSPDVPAITQTQNLLFPTIPTKPVASTVPYSSSSSTSSLITSTPVSSNLSTQRINILNSTILTPPHVVSSVQQRIVLPNTVKSSPAKVPIKSTPIKPMPTKNKPIQKLPSTRKITKNDSSDVMNLDFDSPYSPGSSDYEDLFEPPPESGVKPSKQQQQQQQQKTTTKSPVKSQNAFDSLFGSSPMYSINKNKTVKSDKTNKSAKKSLPLPPIKGNTDPKVDLWRNEVVSGSKQIGVKLDEDNLKILDELPNSAVEMQVKDKFLKKLNRQERVVEEVKLVLKPHYNKKHINKEEYKDILRRAVPKICHNRSGEINPKKIQNLIEAYVRKVRHSKKVTSSSSIQKV